MTVPARRWWRPCSRRLAAFATLITVPLLLSQPARAETIRIAWIADRTADSILITSALLAFHDGNLDFFDHDRPANPLLAQSLPAMQSLGLTQLQEALRQTHAPAEFQAWISVPHPYTQGAFSPTPPRWPKRDLVLLDLQPGAHDFLSFLIPLQPSNDAFLGNEDPRRHRLFDAQGRFTGPFQIEVFGAEAFDAGLCGNDEAGLIWLDRPMGGGHQACTGGEGLVRQHPGLNGSQRNPDGVPVRVLGATGTYPANDPLHFDAEAADFTRPGRRLGRLIVSRSTEWLGPSGSWYSPERAGEGFSLQLLAPAGPGAAPRALVYWYTYAPDGSGRQVWLTGIGNLGPAHFSSGHRATIQIDLHSTQGGRFASTSNPAEVVALPWGGLSIGFTDCERATVAYTPSQAGYPAGSFDVHRLGPPIEGLDWLCTARDPQLPQPRPDREAP
jgi:hypothetical protein